MDSKHLISLIAMFVCVASPIHARAEGDAYIVQQNNVFRLADMNADGDFLDFGEVALYAGNVGSSLDSIAWHLGRLYAVINQPPGILIMEDMNGDGDALDFAEVRTFASFQPAAHTLKDIAALPDGSHFCGNASDFTMIRFRDLNADGDALDFEEVEAVAAFGGTIRAISARPDGLLLVATASEPEPVRVLQDRNLDGDFFDFAENLSYVENLPPGVDLQSPLDHVAFLSRPTHGDVVRLQDRTLDDDALDFAECTGYASGLDGIGAIAWRDDTLFAALTAQTVKLVAIRDLNEDGDAFDFGEIQEVAVGFESITAIAVPTPSTECLLGDTNVDGLVTPADIQSMANALVGVGSSLELCRTDMNGDGLLNGRDVPLFVSALLD